VLLLLKKQQEFPVQEAEGMRWRSNQSVRKVRSLLNPTSTAYGSKKETSCKWRRNNTGLAIKAL
jgi:hypothetical protein